MKKLEYIARIHTDFPTKFGIPRQSGLVSTKGTIVFEPEYRKEEALKGLEEYLKTNTDNIYAYQVLSNFYVNDGKVNEAIKLLKRGIELNPDDKLLKNSLEMVLNGEY